jgi:hypothetical protein
MWPPNILAGARTCPTGDGGECFDWKDDTMGHGTHVSGTILARADGSGVVGVLPYGARLWMTNPFGYLVRGLVLVLSQSFSAELQVAGLTAGHWGAEWCPGAGAALQWAPCLASRAGSVAPLLAPCTPGPLASAAASPGRPLASTLRLTGLLRRPFLWQDTFDSNELLVGWDKCVQHWEGLKKSVNPAMKLVISMSVGGWLPAPAACCLSDAPTPAAPCITMPMILNQKDKIGKLSS